MAQEYLTTAQLFQKASAAKVKRDEAQEELKSYGKRLRSLVASQTLTEDQRREALKLARGTKPRKRSASAQ
jgi:hypothetical protein